jgi:hypothetical protein
MKNAEEWLIAVENVGPTKHVHIIRQIQADALRWAANLSGSLHRAWALEAAEKLDPQRNNCPTSNK